MTQAWPPKGWTIKRVTFTEDSPEPRTGQLKGEYWQGVRTNGKGSTCFYKDYNECMEAVLWYDKGFKYGEL